MYILFYGITNNNKKLVLVQSCHMKNKTMNGWTYYINEWKVLDKLVTTENYTVEWKKANEKEFKMNFKLLAIFIAFIVAVSIMSSAEAAGPAQIKTSILYFHLRPLNVKHKCHLKCRLIEFYLPPNGRFHQNYHHQIITQA